MFAPFLLDFAAATIDTPPKVADWDTPAWRAEKRRTFGKHWPDIQLLLDALRLYGIYFCDVHPGNIRPA